MLLYLMYTLSYLCICTHYIPRMLLHLGSSAVWICPGWIELITSLREPPASFVSLQYFRARQCVCVYALHTLWIRWYTLCQVCVPSPSESRSVYIPQLQYMFAVDIIKFHIHIHNSNSWEILDINLVGSPWQYTITWRPHLNHFEQCCSHNMAMI